MCSVKYEFHTEYAKSAAIFSIPPHNKKIIKHDLFFPPTPHATHRKGVSIHGPRSTSLMGKVSKIGPCVSHRRSHLVLRRSVFFFSFSWIWSLVGWEILGAHVFVDIFPKIHGAYGSEEWGLRQNKHIYTHTNTLEYFFFLACFLGGHEWENISHPWTTTLSRISPGWQPILQSLCWILQDLEGILPRKTNKFPEKGTISVGKRSSAPLIFNGTLVRFQGV